MRSSLALFWAFSAFVCSFPALANPPNHETSVKPARRQPHAGGHATGASKAGLFKRSDNAIFYKHGQTWYYVSSPNDCPKLKLHEAQKLGAKCDLAVLNAAIAHSGASPSLRALCPMNGLGGTSWKPFVRSLPPALSTVCGPPKGEQVSSVPNEPPKEEQSCGEDELLNASTGECVHGLFLPDRRDVFGRWRLPKSADHAQTVSTVQDMLGAGIMEFDEHAADALNSLFLSGGLRLASKRDGTNGRVAALNTTVLADRGCKKHNDTFAAVVRVKNQAWALNEYMAHYSLLGISHIFILDDSSEDNLLDVAEPWTRVGLLTIISKEGKVSATADSNSFQAALAEYDWVGWLDMDEYVMPFRHRCIPDMLKLYRDYGGVKLHWSLYEGHISDDVRHSLHQRSLPQTTLYEALDYRLGKWQGLTKEIGQSQYTQGLERHMPHCLRYKHGWYPVNEAFQRADGRHINGSSVNASPCWLGGPPGVGETSERLVALLHVRAITLESWLERAVRVFNSAPHDREGTRKTFDLHSIVSEFQKKKVPSEPMPSEMSAIAHELSVHMRWLVST